MTFEEYQEESKKTFIYPGKGFFLGLTYVALGIAGEAGEVANKTKKIMRDNECEIDSYHRDLILDELGDTLWYLSQVATELGTSLNKIALQNIFKLRGRQERGTLQGSGDR